MEDVLGEDVLGKATWRAMPRDAAFSE